MKATKYFFAVGAMLLLGSVTALAGCGDKASSDDTEAVKNASQTKAPAAPGEAPKKPMVAPPPP